MQEAPPLPRQSPRKAVLKKRIQMLQSAARRVIQRDVASKRRFRMRPRKLDTNVEEIATQTAAELEVKIQQTTMFRSAMQALCRHCKDCPECNASPVQTLQIAPDGELKIGATRAAHPKAWIGVGRGFYKIRDLLHNNWQGIRRLWQDAV